MEINELQLPDIEMPDCLELDESLIGLDDDYLDLGNGENSEEDYQPVYLDICGLVKKMKSKKRNTFKITKETAQLQCLIDHPPNADECYKMLSVGGGFSSIAIIKYIADREPIKNMYVSTFRIGKAQFAILHELFRQRKIEKASFITSSTQRKTDAVMEYNGKRYRYFDYVQETCKKNGWRLKVLDNHSKLIIMQTEKNSYVVETSSNLNENPKMEQFNFENDVGLYSWYEQLFNELMMN